MSANQLGQSRTGQYTDQVVDYVANFKYENVPVEVIQYTKKVIMDTVGVIWASSAKKTRISQLICNFVNGLGGKEEATIIGSKAKNNAVNVALANGTMAHDIIELDEVHPQANTHTSAVIIPAALALAEREGKTGKDFIASVVLAFDIECRIGKALDDTAVYGRAFHPTSVCGVFGAATAGAYLLQLNREQTRNALGLAGCQASGLIAWETESFHMSKSFQTGMAARDGVTAALLAKSGYHAPPAILDGKYNIFDAFSGKYNYEKLTDDLGKNYEIMNAGLKKYASCRYTHSPLDAFLGIMEEEKLSSDEIKKVTVNASEAAVLITDNNELLTHNVQLVLAMAAYDKKIQVEQYLEGRYKNPEVQELAKKIVCIADPELTKLYPEDWAAEIVINTVNGKEFRKRVNNAAGDPRNPFTDQELKQKFSGLLEQNVDHELVDRGLDLLDDLENITDIKVLTSLLRTLS